MQNCYSCTIAQGEGKGYQAPRYVVELDGGWILDHCAETENAYLGYLILATKKHRRDLQHLSREEINTLGINLEKIIVNIRKYWIDHLDKFDDRIERVHVAYLNEGPYINKDKNMNKSHVHFHIFPRTKRMMPRRSRNRVGWRLLDLIDTFPDYLRSRDSDKEALMLYLKHALPGPG